MSWKSFVSAGLLCVVASPVFAAPTITAVGGGTQAGTGGYLDANGNLVWQVRIAASNPVPGGAGGTPLAAEIGLVQVSTRPGSANGNVVTPAGSLNNNTAVWDTNNPGNPIFGWETLTDVDPGAGTNMKPVGVQRNSNEIFAALGSAPISVTTPQNFLRIEVEEPRTNAANQDSISTLTLDGAYDSSGNPVAAPGGNRARIAELTGVGGSTSANYHYQGSMTIRARAGDTDLNGQIAFGDYTTLLNNYNVNDGNRQWYHGDYNGDGDVAFGDYTLLLNNYQQTYTVLTGSYNLVPPPGAGSGGGAAAAVAAPEPASVALLALAALGVGGLRCRRRS